MYGVWSVHVLVVLYLVAFLFLLLHVRRRFTAPQRISQFFQVRTVGIVKDLKKVSNYVQSGASYLSKVRLCFFLCELRGPRACLGNR